MGATSWRHYTPYRPDSEAALQSLRAEVFARGEYVDPTGPLQITLRQTARRFGQDPDSPVLDIEHTAPQPGFGVAAPMSAAALRRVFRSAEPTRDQVEMHWQEIAEPLDRWQARYLVVYRDGLPHEYAFIGCSGD